MLHGRDGLPHRGLVVCDVDDGARCYGTVTDALMLDELEQEECVGRMVTLVTNEANVNEVTSWARLTMTKDEREAFLAETHIAVLAVAGGESEAPVLTPIWYSYQPGDDVVVTTDAGSRKTAQLRSAGTASLCVQTEAPPYAYVVVEGPVTMTDGVDSGWRRDLAVKYLGDLGPAYYDSTMEHESTAVTVRLTPQKWRTTDYNKLF